LFENNYINDQVSIQNRINRDLSSKITEIVTFLENKRDSVENNSPPRYRKINSKSSSSLTSAIGNYQSKKFVSINKISTPKGINWLKIEPVRTKILQHPSSPNSIRNDRKLLSMSCIKNIRFKEDLYKTRVKQNTSIISLNNRNKEVSQSESIYNKFMLHLQQQNLTFTIPEHKINLNSNKNIWNDESNYLKNRTNNNLQNQIPVS